MKKVAVKVLSVLLCLLMVVPCFSILTSAENVTYRKGSNDVSSAYKGSRFYKNLTQIPLTGDGVTDVLAVALSQLGYVEGTNQSGLTVLRAAAEIILNSAIIWALLADTHMLGVRLTFPGACFSRVAPIRIRRARGRVIIWVIKITYGEK